MLPRLTAREVQKPIDELELNSVPLWPDQLVEEAFWRIRDERWLDSNSSPNIKRRIPWLYIDNGCYLRAALIRRMFETWGYPPIKKVFCFGSMEFNTPWTKSGQITYKDHVAVVLRNSSECLVIDPPISFNGPLTLVEWLSALHGNGKAPEAKVSICSALTVGHNSYFDESDPLRETGMRGGEMKSMDYFTSEFLSKEWDRVLELGFDPLKVLGGQPPWAGT